MTKHGKLLQSANHTSRKRRLELCLESIKHVKSNAIVLANEKPNGGDWRWSMNRIGSVKIAVDQAQAVENYKGRLSK